MKRSKPRQANQTGVMADGGPATITDNGIINRTNEKQIARNRSLLAPIVFLFPFPFFLFAFSFSSPSSCPFFSCSHFQFFTCLFCSLLDHLDFGADHASSRPSYGGPYARLDHVIWQRLACPGRSQGDQCVGFCVSASWRNPCPAQRDKKPPVPAIHARRKFAYRKAKEISVLPATPNPRPRPIIINLLSFSSPLLPTSTTR